MTATSTRRWMGTEANGGIERALAHVLAAATSLDAKVAAQCIQTRGERATEMTSGNDTMNTVAARTSIQNELAKWERYDRPPHQRTRCATSSVVSAPRAVCSSVGRGVCEGSLLLSWNGFIRLWNAESDFGDVLRPRESARGPYGLGPLRQDLHNVCWDEARYCFVNVRESCPHCSAGTSRSSVADWEADVRVAPLGDRIRRLIGLYERALKQAKRAGVEFAHYESPISTPREWMTPRHSEAEPARHRTSLQYPERRAASWIWAPMYHPREESRATERDTDARSGWRWSDETSHGDWRGEEHPVYVERHHGGQRDDPQSSADSQRYLSTEEDRIAGSRSSLGPHHDVQTQEDAREAPSSPVPYAASAVAPPAPELSRLDRLEILSAETDAAKNRALDAEEETQRLRDELAGYAERLNRVEQSHAAYKEPVQRMRRHVGWAPEQPAPKRRRTSRYESASSQHEEEKESSQQHDAATPRPT